MANLSIVEFYNNLKNYDFDLFGSYNIDQTEAKKVMRAIEDENLLTYNTKQKVEEIQYVDGQTWLTGICPNCKLPISYNHSQKRCSMCGVELEWETANDNR